MSNCTQSHFISLQGHTCQSRVLAVPIPASSTSLPTGHPLGAIQGTGCGGGTDPLEL